MARPTADNVKLALNELADAIERGMPADQIFPRWKRTVAAALRAFEPGTSGRNGLEHGSLPPSQEQHGTSASAPDGWETEQVTRALQTWANKAREDGLPVQALAWDAAIAHIRTLAAALSARPPAIDGVEWNAAIEKAARTTEDQAEFVAGHGYERFARQLGELIRTLKRDSESHGPSSLAAGSAYLHGRDLNSALRADAPKLGSPQAVEAGCHAPPAQGSAGWRALPAKPSEALLRAGWHNVTDAEQSYQQLFAALTPPVEAQGSERMLEALTAIVRAHDLWLQGDGSHTESRKAMELAKAALGDSSPATPQQSKGESDDYWRGWRDAQHNAAQAGPSKAEAEHSSPATEERYSLWIDPGPKR